MARRVAHQRGSMVAHPRMIATVSCSPKRSAIRGDGRFVFAMGRDRERRFGKNPLQRLLIVHEQIARAGADKDFDAGSPLRSLSSASCAAWPRCRSRNSRATFAPPAPVSHAAPRLLIVAGRVLGISRNVVTPPLAQARLAERRSSLCVKPGSRKWTWSSTRPAKGATRWRRSFRLSSPKRPGRFGRSCRLPAGCPYGNLGGKDYRGILDAGGAEHG